MALSIFTLRSPRVNYWQFCLCRAVVRASARVKGKRRAAHGMANDGISFRRGGGGFPSLACLVLSDRFFGGNGPTGVRNTTHMMGERRQEGKDRDWHGTVYGVPSKGEKASSPPSRASSPCNPPLGRSSGRVRPESLFFCPTTGRRDHPRGGLC